MRMLLVKYSLELALVWYTGSLDIKNRELKQIMSVWFNFKLKLTRLNTFFKFFFSFVLTTYTPNDPQY